MNPLQSYSIQDLQNKFIEKRKSK